MMISLMQWVYPTKTLESYSRSILSRKVSSVVFQLRYRSKKSEGKYLKLSDINQNTVAAKYAVRGSIPIRADELDALLHSGKKHTLPFDKIVQANIGNPQQLDQKPLTWYRQVLSIVQYPDILNTPEANIIYPSDVIERAKILIEAIKSAGAYSNSQGVEYIRKSVADFISKRDGYPSDPKDIFLTSGASSAVSYLLQILASNKDSAFLIPIPQYPLYTASIALNDSKPVGYYLNEENNWSTDPEQIRGLLEKSIADGTPHINSLVIINPGNPTGSILSKKEIVEVINIAADYGIVLIADEVYQVNIFKGEFLSFKKVLCELLENDHEKYKDVQLASLHSISKGVSGECGQRGGFMELFGFKHDIKNILFKLASINLCSVVSGQVLMELMVNPPKKGDPSYGTYHREVSHIQESLRTRADLLYNAFCKMTDVSCNKPMGAMYLFPRLHFTKDKYPEIFKLAEFTKTSVDEFYCLELLEKTGICSVPGSGFGQVPGTLHVRTTFLPPGKEWIERWVTFHEEFVQRFKTH